jgi:putative protease
VTAEAHRHGAEVVFNLPRISREEEMSALKSLFPWDAGDGIMVANLGLWHEFKDLGRPVFWDHPLYTFNQAAAMAAEQEGAAGVTASLELRREELALLAEGAPLPVETVVHGRLTLMVSAHCVAGSVVGGRAPGKACSMPCAQRAFGLKDRLGLVFPMAMDLRCRAHIYNPMELCLVDRLPELAEIPLASLRVEAQGRTTDYVARVVGIYRRGLDKTIHLPLEQAAGELAQMREDLLALSPQGLTRGHFHRGVE